jgi:WD40 repeat protein
VALSAHGRRAVSAGEDGVLCVWDLTAILAGGAPTAADDAQPAWRLATFWNYDGLHAVALRREGDLRVWKIGSGWPIPHPQAIVSVKIEGTSALYPQPTFLAGRAAEPGAPPVHTGGRTYMAPMVALTPDGRWAVAGHEHDKMVVWDLEAGSPVALLKGHTNWVQAAAITADGRRVVSGGSDGTVRVWDLPEVPPPRIPPMSRKKAKRLDRRIHYKTITHGVAMRILGEYSQWAEGVAVTADGARIVSTGDDDRLRVWNPAGMTPPRVFPDPADVYGPPVLTADGRQALVGTSAGHLRVVDLEHGTVGPRLTGHGAPAAAVALTPDGRWAVTGEGSLGLAVRVWNLATADPLPSGAEHYRYMMDVVVTPDGRRAVAASNDGMLRVWNPPGDVQPTLLPAQTQIVSAVALSADGRRLVAGGQDARLRVWDLASGAPPTVRPGHSEVVADLPNRRPARWSIYDRQEVDGLAITPDGRRAVSGGADFTVRVWDLEGRVPPVVLSDLTQCVWALAISADGQRIVSGGNGETVRVWDLGAAPGPELWPLVLSGHTAWVRAVALTPDGRRLASGSADRTVRVWDLGTPTGPALIAVLQGHTGAVLTVGLSADGRRAVSGGEDGMLRVWDVAGGSAIARYTWDAPVRYCALGPDGTVTVGDGRGQILFFTLVEPPS